MAVPSQSGQLPRSATGSSSLVGAHSRRKHWVSLGSSPSTHPQALPSPAAVGYLPVWDLDGRGERSSATWTSSSGDCGNLSDTDDLQDRFGFVEEYNRLATRHGIRLLIPDDYNPSAPGQSPDDKRSWFSRTFSRQTSGASNSSDKSGKKHMSRKRSVSDIAMHIVHPMRRADLRDEDLQSLVRLCGKSMLYLPSEYAPRSLILPTCLRAAAQYLVQHAAETRGIFRIPGSTRFVGALYDYYCAEHESDDISRTIRCPNLPLHIKYTAHDVASTFKRFLAGLPGGILGSLSLFDALVAIHSQLKGDAEVTKTKQSKLRARLIALAVGSLRSRYRRELICAVFGLLSLIGRTAETTPREDEQGRPLPTNDLMGYNALGIVFGPLLVGSLLDSYTMKIASPNAGLILLPVTPPRTKKEKRRNKIVDDVHASALVVDRIHVANGITEMLITHWREVVRHLKTLGALKASIHTPRSTTLRTAALRPSASESFLVQKPAEWLHPSHTVPAKLSREGSYSSIPPSPTPTSRNGGMSRRKSILEIKRRRPRSVARSSSVQRLNESVPVRLLSPTVEEVLPHTLERCLTPRTVEKEPAAPDFPSPTPMNPHVDRVMPLQPAQVSASFSSLEPVEQRQSEAGNITSLSKQNLSYESGSTVKMDAQDRRPRRLPQSRSSSHESTARIGRQEKPYAATKEETQQYKPAAAPGESRGVGLAGTPHHKTERSEHRPSTVWRSTIKRIPKDFSTGSGCEPFLGGSQDARNRSKLLRVMDGLTSTTDFAPSKCTAGAQPPELSPRNFNGPPVAFCEIDPQERMSKTSCHGQFDERRVQRKPASEPVFPGQYSGTPTMSTNSSISLTPRVSARQENKREQLQAHASSRAAHESVRPWEASPDPHGSQMTGKRDNAGTSRNRSSRDRTDSSSSGREPTQQAGRSDMTRQINTRRWNSSRERRLRVRRSQVSPRHQSTPKDRQTPESVTSYQGSLPYESFDTPQGQSSPEAVVAQPIVIKASETSLEKEHCSSPSPRTMMPKLTRSTTSENTNSDRTGKSVKVMAAFFEKANAESVGASKPMRSMKSWDETRPKSVLSPYTVNPSPMTSPIKQAALTSSDSVQSMPLPGRSGSSGPKQTGLKATWTPTRISMRSSENAPLQNYTTPRHESPSAADHSATSPLSRLRKPGEEARQARPEQFEGVALRHTPKTEQPKASPVQAADVWAHDSDSGPLNPGRMTSYCEEPEVATYTNFPRPPAIVPCHHDSVANVEAPSGNLVRQSSNSLLHAQIRRLHKQLEARKEEVCQLRRQLEAKANLDLATLSEQLRQTKRECRMWRERAEAAEKRVAVFERFMAKIRRLKEQSSGDEVGTASASVAACLLKGPDRSDADSEVTDRDVALTPREKKVTAGTSRKKHSVGSHDHESVGKMDGAGSISSGSGTFRGDESEDDTGDSTRRRHELWKAA